ncbi:MAG TPA: matrixin family metalloprotease [Actinotalea sp.]|nr:matrixin family metalloprotease [Actinotalea sp.]
MADPRPVPSLPVPAPSRPRTHWGRAVGAGLVLGLGAAVAIGAHLQGLDLTDPSDLRFLVHPRAYVVVDGRAVAVPRPEPSQGRLAPEVPVTTSGTHAFLHVDDEGEPVGYDPCRPVRWVLREDGAPLGGDVLVAESVAAVAAATGLVFEFGGVTDEPPFLDRPIIQEDRYGEAWAPVLIAWADETEVHQLTGQVAGIGGSAAVPGATGDGEWLAAGRLVLDREDLGAMIERGDIETARAVILHELAHVVGLDHVADESELMNPTTSATSSFGPGDLAGLARVGAVRCQP